MNRSTITLLAILVVLGAIVFFLIPGEKEHETSYTPGDVHFTIDSANTVKIDIQRMGKKITIENIGGKWTITSPIMYLADPSAVNQLLSGCTKFKPGSLISSNPEKQFLFQVDTAGTKLTITGRSGKPASIILGKMGPSFSDIYFRLPESNDVYLGQGIDSWLISKDIKDWRDKTIISQPSETIKDIAYQVGNRKYDFHRDTSGWKSDTKSFDPSSMNTALNTLANLRAEDFIDTAMKPQAQPVTIQIRGIETSTLQVSPSLPDSSKYYVKTQSSQSTFVISKFTAQQLMKPVEQYGPAPSRPTVAAEKPRAITPPAVSKPGKVTQTAQGTPKPSTHPLRPAPKKETPAETKTTPIESKTTATPTQTTTPPAPGTTGKTGTAQQNGKEKVGSTAQPAEEDEGDLQVYTVLRGETMTTIAKKFNVTVEQILKWNLLKSISVTPGQELYIYQRKKK